MTTPASRCERLAAKLRGGLLRKVLEREFHFEGIHDELLLDIIRAVAVAADNTCADRISLRAQELQRLAMPAQGG